MTYQNALPSLSNHFSNQPIILGWHGYKLTATDAELVIVGHGFGNTPGLAQIVEAGGGRSNADVRVWSDQFVRLTVPVDATIILAQLRIPRERGFSAAVVKTPAGSTASTGDNTPSWSGTVVTAAPDALTISGTGLSGVEQVYLFDEDAPASISLDLPVEDGGDLIVEWPDSFTGEIEEIRLVGAGGDEVEQVLGSFSPAAGPIITGIVGVLLPGGSPGLDIHGNRFGEAEGIIRGNRVGAGVENLSVLQNGWTNNLVRVAAVSGATYDNVELVTDDGQTTSLAGAVVAPQSTGISVTNIEAFPLGLRVHGNGLLNASFLKTWRSGSPRFYDRGGWFGRFGSVWTDNILEVRYDYGADDLAPVDQIQVTGSNGDSPVIDAPDLGGPWDMDDPAT